MLAQARSLVVPCASLHGARSPRRSLAQRQQQQRAGRSFRRYAGPEDRQPAGAKPIDSEWAQEVIKEVIDSPDMGRRGEAYFAAQVALALLVAFPPGFLRPLADAAGWLAVGGGLGLLVAGQQALGANLSPLPKPRDSATLVTTGVFGYVRHPMYGGLVLLALGCSLVSGDELRLLLCLPFFLVLDQKASVEEGLLGEKFGAGYEELKKRTKKLVPYLY